MTTSCELLKQTVFDGFGTHRKILLCSHFINQVIIIKINHMKPQIFVIDVFYAKKSKTQLQIYNTKYVYQKTIKLN